MLMTYIIQNRIVRILYNDRDFSDRLEQMLFPSQRNCLYPMQSAEDSTKIRILEIYASEKAYQQHLKTDHFQKYKQGTLHMVKDLKLPTMKPLDPETMKLIFKKQR